MILLILMLLIIAVWRQGNKINEIVGHLLHDQPFAVPTEQEKFMREQRDAWVKKEWERRGAK